GPQFGAVPQFGNYQAGVHASRVRPWTPPVTISAEASLRRESGTGVEFDHGFLTTDLTLFEDHPDRVRGHRQEGFTTDVHLRLEVGGSYHRLAGSPGGWGWGGR